jgi:hypothetical protein
MAGRFDDYIRKARGIVRRHGWLVQAVLPDENQPAYSYSVGLSGGRFRHPEIFMVGFHPDLCRSLINVAGGHVKDGLRFDRACYSDVIAQGFPVAFMPLDRDSVTMHSNAGLAILGKDFGGVLLVLPDVTGRFPWDIGCDPNYAGVQTSLLRMESDSPPSPDARVPPRQ